MHQPQHRLYHATLLTRTEDVIPPQQIHDTKHAMLIEVGRHGEDATSVHPPLLFSRSSWVGAANVGLSIPSNHACVSASISAEKATQFRLAHRRANASNQPASVDAVAPSLPVFCKSFTNTLKSRMLYGSSYPLMEGLARQFSRGKLNTGQFRTKKTKKLANISSASQSRYSRLAYLRRGLACDLSLNTHDADTWIE